MPRKTTQKKRDETGNIIDSIKALVIEGINLYIKLKPLFKKKRKGKKSNDRGKINNN
jgi:hypothetical protein